MGDFLKKIWSTREVRSKLLFVLWIMIIFRIAAHLPIPGVNAAALQNLFAQNQLLGFINIFSGGALENFSVVMLGVGPYITASIIFQILQMIVPRLEDMVRDEGEAGQRKINQYTRLLTVPLAALQGYGTITLLQNAAGGTIFVGGLSLVDWVVAITVVTAGSVFLMWLGELITEKQIGNGVSLVIFSGIIAGLPSGIQQIGASFDSTQVPALLGFLVVGLITIIGVVYMTEGQRNIPISHARHYAARNQNSHLPMRLNQAGVIPIIFAVSLVLAPSFVAQFLLQMNIPWANGPAQAVVNAFQNQLFYGIVYFVLVVVFTYFYTGVVFRPDRIAENLQRQGSFIPGIRPGEDTMAYLQRISNRLLLVGSLFLGVIAILPLIIQALFSGTFSNLAIGGTSILIVVSVALETVKQLEAQLSLRDYDRL